MLTRNDEFLRAACEAALAAGHVWPEYAACEAALESAKKGAFGESRLALEANNLFGQKQGKRRKLPYPTVSWNTWEDLNGPAPGGDVIQRQEFLKFPDWQTCFKERMALLHALAPACPNYAAALAAPTGDQFIFAVSRTWSTDPARATKVLRIFRDYQPVLILARATSPAAIGA